MMLDSATEYANNSLEQSAPRYTRAIAGDSGTASRKHFLDSYKEHLAALRTARPAK